MIQGVISIIALILISVTVSGLIIDKFISIIWCLYQIKYIRELNTLVFMTLMFYFSSKCPHQFLVHVRHIYGESKW